MNAPLSVAENNRLDRLTFLRVPHGKPALKVVPLEDVFCSEDLEKGHLIKGVLAWNETSAWIAPPGGMKSALMASAAIHVALGKDWFGKKNKQAAGVVYFALERADLVKRRLVAHRQRLGLSEDDPIPIVIISGMLDLMNPATVPLVVEAVNRAEAYFISWANDINCAGLLIFDTFAKLIAAGGGDENSAKDQGRVFANIQRIKDELGGVHVAIVGHTGKNVERGARGSNAIYGDVDMMVEISGSGDIRTATVTKANDAPEGELFSFKSEIHEFGHDDDGEPITVNIVNGEEQSVQVAPKGRETRLTANQGTFYRILYDAGGEGLTLDEWNAKAKDVGIGISRKATLHDLRKALEDRQMVREYGGRWKVSHD